MDNFHLTLKFLDEISLGQQKQIDEAMTKLSLLKQTFRLELSGVGIFEGRDTVRVLWLGLAGDMLALRSLQKSIDHALAPLGFPSEKRSYTPHITIGQDIVFECGFDEIRNAMGDVHFGPVRVNNLFLFKSEQVGNKRIYTIVAQYDLKGDSPA